MPMNLYRAKFAPLNMLFKEAGFKFEHCVLMVPDA